MASLRKPKKLKLPKRPKAGASSQVLENWLKKANEVKKKNAQRLAAYNSEVKKRENLKKKISGIN